MSTGRTDRTGLALLAAAAGVWLTRGALVWPLAAQVPELGQPLIALLLRAAALLLLAAGLYRLRAPLSASLGAVLALFDRAEERLEKLPGRRGPFIRAVTVGLLVGGAVVVAFEGAQLGAALETRAVDLFFRLRFPERSQVELATGQELPSANPQPDVVVLSLDDDTVAHLGWPMPRLHYARLIDAVAAAGPASLTFDISLVDPSREHPEWDAEIGEAARRAGKVGFTFTIARATADTRATLSEAALRALEQNVIPWHDSAAGLPDYSELIGGDAVPQAVIDPVASHAAAIAMANVLLDGGDDVLRHSLLAARLGEQLFPSVSLRLAAQALGVSLSEIRIHPGSHVDLGGKRRIPIDEVGRTLVRYQGRHQVGGDGPFRYLSIWDLLRSDATVTLSGNPFGDDQRFILDETTRVTLDGRSVLLAEVPRSRLKAGSAIAGTARYSPDPGRLLTLDLSSAPAPPEPSFELIDEQTVQFSTTFRELRRTGGDASVLKGKHVLVGSTALAAADLRISPLGEIPGVEHHATMLANLLHDDLFHPTPGWVNAGVVLGAALVAGTVGVLLPAGAGLLVTAVGLLALLTGCFLLFASGWYLPVVGPSVAMSLTYLSTLVMGSRAARNAHARSEREREFVRQTFGRYLTEQVVQQLLDSPDGLRLGGKRKFVTIMMTDLRGFTSMCGTMEPENVVRLLNHYLEAMTRIIARYGGTIDEFIGDAILVVFGAPMALEQEELRAVACAIEMLNAMPEINRWNVENGLPRVEMGIGIHSGEVVLGNIGSELRAKYGIVGSTINLTSRVESYTVGGQVLLSEATRERCGEALSIGGTQVVSPKGVKGTISLHEALAVGAPFEVRLQSASEELLPPRVPLQLRYGLIKNKQVAELSKLAVVEALSERGMELRVDEELAVLSDLQLRLLEGTTLRAGDLYGKVLKANIRPQVIYLRLTSVPPELGPVLELARGGAVTPPSTVTDSALVST